MRAVAKKVSHHTTCGNCEMESVFHGEHITGRDKLGVVDYAWLYCPKCKADFDIQNYSSEWL